MRATRGTGGADGFQLSSRAAGRLRPHRRHAPRPARAGAPGWTVERAEPDDSGHGRRRRRVKRMSSPIADNPAPPARVPFWQAGWFNTLARFAALALVFCFFAAMVDEGRFYTARNLENIGRQSTVYAIAALGATLVIVSGGIDLSVGAILALAVVMVAWVLNLADRDAEGRVIRFWIEDYPRLLPAAAVLAGVAAATVAGLVNGMLVIGLRLVPFIVTLGTMGIFRGLAKGLADERDLYPPQTWLTGLMDPTLTSGD